MILKKYTYFLFLLLFLLPMSLVAQEEAIEEAVEEEYYYPDEAVEEEQYLEETAEEDYYYDEAVEEDYYYEEDEYREPKEWHDWEGDYLKDSYRKHQLNKNDWRAITNNLDYSEKKKKKKPTEETEIDTSQTNIQETPDNDRSNGPLFSGDGRGFIKMFSIIILIGILVAIILRLMGVQNFLSNKKITSEQRQVFDINEIEANIHESDLERFLRESVEVDDYKMAIRLYYLMIIKELSDARFINWKRDKTNREYVREMNKTMFSKPFQHITRLFEYTWYSNVQLSDSMFAEIQPIFKNFLGEIKKG